MYKLCLLYTVINTFYNKGKCQEQSVKSLKSYLFLTESQYLTQDFKKCKKKYIFNSDEKTVIRFLHHHLPINKKSIMQRTHHFT